MAEQRPPARDLHRGRGTRWRLGAHRALPARAGDEPQGRRAGQAAARRTNRRLSAPSLDALRRSARDCRRCDLHERATQTVFGAGPARAELVLVGEQPGDREDVEGKPFVGPAGRVLEEALDEAGVQRGEVYLTNAVKHFKWRPRGKRRLHETPRAPEINACRPWLESELAAVEPRGVLALGAIAARTLFGPK